MDCSEQWTNFPPNASQQTWEIFIQWRDIVSSDACHYKLLPFTTCDSVTKNINSYHHSGGSIRWLKQDDSANCNQQHLLMLPIAGLCSCDASNCRFVLLLSTVVGLSGFTLSLDFLFSCQVIMYSLFSWWSKGIKSLAQLLHGALLVTLVGSYEASESAAASSAEDGQKSYLEWFAIAMSRRVIGPYRWRDFVAAAASRINGEADILGEHYRKGPIK